MSLVVATLIDVDALAHVAVISVVATCGLVLSFGVAVLSVDRIDGARGENGVGTPPVWVAALFCASVIAIGIVVLGVWAMTQKS